MAYWTIFLTVVFLAFLSICELIFLFLDIEVAAVIGRIAFIGMCVSMVPAFKIREWALSLFAITLAFGLYHKDNNTTNLVHSLDRAAFFATFIYLVTLLKEAAQHSVSVLKLGKFMTSQPAGKRYFSLAFGGHIMGVLLNFGAISLLTPLIQRGARASAINAPEGAVSVIEQQQISALIRGFSWMILWSPTALTQAVLFTAFPGVDLKVVIVLGIASSIVMILIGQAEDRFRWRNAKVTQKITVPQFPCGAAFRFLLICLSLIGLTFLLRSLADVSSAIALMLAAPIIMTLWIFEQNFSTNFSKAFIQTRGALKGILLGSANVLARSAFILGIAGFIGEAAAKLAPVQLLADQLATFQIPTWLFLISLPLIINICGQIAISPILVVVFLSSIINQLPILPADPNLIVYALGVGWALSMSLSPNASATLLISGITQIAPTTLTWRWNGVYALLCLTVFSLAFIVLSM